MTKKVNVSMGVKNKIPPRGLLLGAVILGDRSAQCTSIRCNTSTTTKPRVQADHIAVAPPSLLEAQKIVVPRNRAMQMTSAMTSSIIFLLSRCEQYNMRSTQMSSPASTVRKLNPLALPLRERETPPLF